jgi:hypothetical protein
VGRVTKAIILTYPSVMWMSPDEAQAKTLKNNAIASLRRGLEVFNGHDDHGRTESVLLHFQHSSEMLTKALLVQKSKEVFDKQKGIAIGLDRALNVATASGYMTAAHGFGTCQKFRYLLPGSRRARNDESRSRRDSQPSIACVRRGRTLLPGTGPSDFHQKRGAIRRSL